MPSQQEEIPTRGLVLHFDKMHGSGAPAIRRHNSGSSVGSSASEHDLTITFETRGSRRRRRKSNRPTTDHQTNEPAHASLTQFLASRLFDRLFRRGTATRDVGSTPRAGQPQASRGPSTAESGSSDVTVDVDGSSDVNRRAS